MGLFLFLLLRWVNSVRSGAYARYLTTLFYAIRSVIYVIELIVLMTLQDGFQLYNDYVTDLGGFFVAILFMLYAQIIAWAVLSLYMPYRAIKMHAAIRRVRRYMRQADVNIDEENEMRRRADVN